MLGQCILLSVTLLLAYSAEVWLFWAILSAFVVVEMISQGFARPKACGATRASDIGCYPMLPLQMPLEITFLLEIFVAPAIMPIKALTVIFYVKTDRLQM